MEYSMPYWYIFKMLFISIIQNSITYINLNNAVILAAINSSD